MAIKHTQRGITHKAVYRFEQTSALWNQEVAKQLFSNSRILPDKLAGPRL